MKLREIKEVGFYHKVNDLERKVIYEIMENADEDWLKEDPEATLLIDTWHYEYKDENDRDRYSVDGNLLTLYLNESDIEVVKIEDTKYKVFGKMGQFLIEDKPTYKELFKHKEKECEELKKEQLEIKKYLGISHKSILERLEELQERREELSEKNIFYEQALDEIKYQTTELYIGVENKDRPYCEKILNIINKAKGCNNAESLNEKLDIKNSHYRKALKYIKEIVKINCEEICGRKFEDCNDFLCPSKNIIDIINKAKGE